MTSPFSTVYTSILCFSFSLVVTPVSFFTALIHSSNSFYLSNLYFPHAPPPTSGTVLSILPSQATHRNDLKSNPKGTPKIVLPRRIKPLRSHIFYHYLTKPLIFQITNCRPSKILVFDIYIKLETFPFEVAYTYSLHIYIPELTNEHVFSSLDN